MPIVVLLILSLALGGLVAYASYRYPTPAVGHKPADKAADKIETQMERHPWLLRLVYERLDPATATGLALTLALGLAIVGGLLVGLLAYLVRSNDALVDADFSVGEWGADHATSWSTDALQLVTDLAGTSFIIAGLVLVSVFEYRRVPNKWVPPFLLTVVVGEILLVNAIKEILDRVRPTFNPIAETFGPLLPERALRIGRRVLRGGCARPGAPALTENARAARRRCGGDRGRGRVQSRSPRCPLDVGRHRRTRLRLGLVRHLRDRVRRALPRARRPGRAGGRHRSRQGPGFRATRQRLGRSDVVEPALQRPDETPSTPRHPGKLDEPMGQRLRTLEELELLRRDALPLLVDQLDRVALHVLER